jgi:hypothetical protein
MTGGQLPWVTLAPGGAALEAAAGDDTDARDHRGARGSLHVLRVTIPTLSHYRTSRCRDSAVAAPKSRMRGLN